MGSPHGETFLCSISHCQEAIKTMQIITICPQARCPRENCLKLTSRHYAGRSQFRRNSREWAGNRFFPSLHHLLLNDHYLPPESRVSGKLLISPFMSHRLSIKSRDPSVLPWSLLAMCHVRKAVFCDKGLCGYGQAASALWRTRCLSTVVSIGELMGARALGDQEPRSPLAPFPACI